MKTIAKRLCSGILVLAMLCSIPMLPARAVEGAPAISLDLSTGLLDVDMAGYLSQHDLVFNNPIHDGKDGLPVGTGRMGALIWNRNGIAMEITNVDAAPYTALPSGLVEFRTDLAMDEGIGFQQRLNLYQGTGTTVYPDGLQLTFMGEARGEVMGIHVVDPRADSRTATVDLSLWLDKLDAYPEGPFSTRPYGNPSVPMPNEETWENPVLEVHNDYVAISRGQEDPNNFGYTLAVAVDGASFTTSTVGEGAEQKLQLQVENSGEYTVWIVNPSRRAADGHNSRAAAQSKIKELQARGYQAVLNEFQAHWADFWGRCFLQYQSNNTTDADYLENSWYLYQYLIGCGSSGEFPYHFINGVWRWDEQDESMWSWDYTSFNERTFAYTHYATNRLELTDSYYNLFYNNLDSGEQYTINRFWNSDKDPRFDPEREGYIPGGVLSPERHTWNGEMQVGYTGTDVGCPYTTRVNASAAEHAMGMFERYKFTGDREYLEQKAYPFMRAVGIYLLNFLQYDEETGTYYSEGSNALEQYWNVTNPINDLVSFRALFQRLIEASEALGQDENLRVMWQDRLDHLAQPITEEAENGGLRYQPHDPPRTAQKNSQNPELDVVWPYNYAGLDSDSNSFSIALNSYLDRKMPLNIWTPEPIVAARLGLGDDSFKHAKEMIARSQTHLNGIHDDRNGMFESNALIVTAINEQMLQSYNDNIRVFPAVISDESFHSKFTLLARGGFLVSSEYAQQKVQYVSIVSQLGGTAHLVNPWGEEDVRISRLDSGEEIQPSISYTASGAQLLCFDTDKDGIYLVECANAPLDGRQHQQMTGTRNEGVKKLTGEVYINTRQLGTAYAYPLTIQDGKVNEDHDSLVYQGSWVAEKASGRFGGTQRYCGTAGASVSFTFIGTAVKLWMPAHPTYGTYRVWLDGQQVGVGDAYASQLEVDHLGFAASGLADGVHQLTLEVLGQYGPSGSQPFVVIDAVEVTDTIPDLARRVSVSSQSGETAITQPSGTLQLQAVSEPTDTQVRWSAETLTGEASSLVTVDQNGLVTAHKNGYVVIRATAQDASLCSDTLLLHVSGQSSQDELWDDRDSRITYTGSWGKWTDSQHYNSTETYSSTPGDSFEFDFEGTGFTLLMYSNHLTGRFNVDLDGKTIAENIDTRVASIHAQNPVYTSPALEKSPHHVKVTVSAGSSGQIKMDAVQIRSTVACYRLDKILQPSAIEVPAGTPFTDLSLPPVVTAMLEDGRICEFDVVWQSESYDPTLEGEQTVTGLVLTSDDVDNPLQLKAEIRVTVQPEKVYYSINISDMTYGKVSADKQRAAAGEIVTLQVTPNNGYHLKEGSLKVYKTDAADEMVRVADNEFIMPAYAVTISAEFEQDAPVVDKTALQNLYNEYKDKVNDNYTDESWNAFLEALKNADNVLGNDEATNEQVEAALADLQNAIEGLEKKEDETCKHTKTELVNAKEPTKYKDGYSGDLVCVHCSEIVKKGYVIPATGSGTTPPVKPVEPVVPSIPFTDVSEGDWFYDSVKYVYDNGLMNGTGANEFSPNSQTTRGMIVTILYRQYGSPSLNSDGKTWWSDARVWAMENRISDGTNMEGSITREQLAAMIYRYAKLTGEDVSASGDLNKFIDRNMISDWAIEAMQWAVGNGILGGRPDGMLDPKGQATRAEVAAMLMRFNRQIG